MEEKLKTELSALLPSNVEVEVRRNLRMFTITVIPKREAVVPVYIGNSNDWQLSTPVQRPKIQLSIDHREILKWNPPVCTTPILRAVMQVALLSDGGRLMSEEESHGYYSINFNILAVIARAIMEQL